MSEKYEPEAAAEIKRLRDRVQALEERLEMTHIWTCKINNPKRARVEIPPEERVIGHVDGIEARDETIKLLDARIAELEGGAAMMMKEIAAWREAFPTHGIYGDKIVGTNEDGTKFLDPELDDK